MGGWLGWPTRNALTGSERGSSYDQGGAPEADNLPAEKGPLLKFGELDGVGYFLRGEK
jgi:hypothetical protein